MPAERTTMRHVREVLRLTTAGGGLNEIARRVGVAPSTVRLTLKRLTTAGLSWPLPAEMTEPETGPHAMVRHLARVVGVGIETADMLVNEVLSRPMRDRKAMARYAG